MYWTPRLDILHYHNSVGSPSETATLKFLMASCQYETKKYRECLREQRSSGRKCIYLAETLEACREKWRGANQIKLEYDGRRILPNPKCRTLNEKVQHCIKQKRGDQTKCKEAIGALEVCMAAEKGIVAAPTSGDKIWSDYKG
mmetsp:Transcript_23065/g.46051  ORF Transcript_23065/g.46051 Transcript_23065/m.46051 type:complete len:143 (-) Transcript_23065:111-539(-)